MKTRLSAEDEQRCRDLADPIGLLVAIATVWIVFWLVGM